MKKILFILTVAILFIGCKKEQGIVLSETNVTMHYDEEKQLSVSFLDEEMDYTFTSSNKNIAIVSPDGLIHGVSIGEAVITAKSTDGQYTAECKVTIKPYHPFLFAELCCNFGAYKNEVKDFEKRELLTEKDQSLLYEGDMPYVAMVGYSFEEYKLIASIILIDTYMKDILATYLVERYEYMGNNNNVIYFKTYDNKVILGLSVSSYNNEYKYSILYFEITSNKSNDINSIINKFQAL